MPLRERSGGGSAELRSGVLVFNYLDGSLTPILSPPSPIALQDSRPSLNFKQGMVQQFNLNIEHQIAG